MRASCYVHLRGRLLFLFMIHMNTHILSRNSPRTQNTLCAQVHYGCSSGQAKLNSSSTLNASQTWSSVEAVACLQCIH